MERMKWRAWEWYESVREELRVSYDSVEERKQMKEVSVSMGKKLNLRSKRNV